MERIDRLIKNENKISIHFVRLAEYSKQISEYLQDKNENLIQILILFFFVCLCLSVCKKWDQPKQKRKC